MTNEFIGGLPIGFGPRVPMIICSPWTRGGFVDSNTYDHTSMLRFLETWTGVAAPNITAWRRSVTGDLTAAFDFTSPDFSVPALPDTVPLITQSDAEKSFPAVAPPAEGAQAMPAQESGTRPHRPSQLMPHADVTVNRSAYTVTATMSNTGSVGVSLLVFPDKYLAASATPFTVVNGTQQDLHVDGGQEEQVRVRLLDLRSGRVRPLVRRRHRRARAPPPARSPG